MASASGGDRKLKPASCKDSHPEHSLSWCLAHLSKPKHPKSDDQSLSGAAKRSHVAQWRALVAIRTHHIKGHRSSISRFRRQGGLEPLLGLIRQTDCSRKTLDLALSILGNCCTERETCSEVRKLDGIKIVVEVMRKHVAQLSIQNRAARVLGNLAVYPENSVLIHAAGGVPLLLLCVSQISLGSSPSSTTSSSSSPPAPCSPTASNSSSAISSPSPPCTPAPPNPDPSPSTAPSASAPLSPASTSLSSSSTSLSSSSAPPVDSSPAQECAQSAARALLYLSDTPPHRLSLVSVGAVALLCPLLAPDLPLALQKTSLRTVHELTRGCGVECARQIVSCGGALAWLGVMATAEEEAGGGAVQELALKTLANLCAQGCLRPLVGSLGVIGRFAAEVKKEPLRGGVFLRALCLCCKEAVNRAKVKESGGLELLIGVLASHRTHPLSRFVIQACVDFVFDEAAVEQFLELGLVPLLAERLVQLSKGEELVCGAGSNPPLPDLLPQGGLNSFDFPPPEEKREQALCSSSFLSLRSWLLSEGLISSEGDLLDSSSTTESDWSGLPVSSPHPAAVSSTHRPSLSSVTSSTPKNPNPPSPSSSSPVKSPSSPTKFRLSSPLRRRPRDKLPVPPRLLPLDTPPRPLTSSSSYHPYHPEPWTPESPLLLLLSRFSHVPDPSALASCKVLSGLLLYLTRRADPSGRCFRMLLRLSVNPSCLQALARSGAAAMIRYRLCEREEGEENSQQSPRVKAKVRQLGLSLLTNLQLQCESGFGAGVLSHTMLTGTESDRLHCALSLPLITSNKTLLRKLLLDSGGLQFALRPLGGATDSDQTSPDQPLHSLYCPLLVGCLSALTANSKPSNKTHLSSTNTENKLTQPPPPKKTHFDQSCCPYSHAESDLAFLLDDGTKIPANRGAVSGDESGSEYFRALLRGGFGEANCISAIRIRDVSAKMLTPVLHHLHGCRFGAAATGRCRALEALVDAELSQNEDFEKTTLGQAMVGACRFLVGDLQKELEEVCVSLLHSEDIVETCDDGHIQDEHVADQSDFEKDMKTQENPVSQTQKRKSTDIMGAKDKLTDTTDELTQDKNVANQLDSEKDAKTLEIPVSKTPKRKRGDVTEAKDKLIRDENVANHLESEKDVRTQQSPASKTPKRKRTDTINAKDKLKEAKEELTLSAGGCASVLDLLPEIYWFSQRYSYKTLGGSCLSLLAGRRFSQSKAGECLQRLTKEADCMDALKKDLIALATNALS